jgi:hypothetical protein
VLEYCDHHQTDPLPTGDEPSADESRKRTTDISEWDQKFITVDQEMLFEIILAANYLDIKPLLYVFPLLLALTLGWPQPSREAPFFTSFVLVSIQHTVNRN